MKPSLNLNSLLIQLIVIILVISVLPVAIVTYNSGIATGNMKQKQFDDRLSDLAVISDQMYESHTDRDNAMARTIARDYGLKTAINNSDSIAIKRIMDGYSGTDKNVSILLATDRNGTILSSASYLNASGCLSDSFINSALAGTGLTGTDVISAALLKANQIDYRTVSTGTADGLGIVCAQPVKDDNGTVIGAIYLVELLNENTNLVDAIASDASGQCTIFMGDVRIATSLKNSYNVRLLGTRMGPTPAPAILLETGKYRSYYDLDDQHYYLNYAPLKNPCGEVVGMIAVGYDVNPSLEEINTLTYMSIATGVLIAVVFAVLGLVYVQRITRPIENLVTAAGKISAGELDTPLEASEDGSEIGDLQIAIRKMVQSIKARINYDESLLKGITDPMLVIDNEARITYFNEPAAKLTSCPASEALGRKYQEIFTILPGKGTAITDYVNMHLFASGFENVLLLGDGRRIIVSGSSAPFTGADGAITGTILLLRDITGQREAEDALQRNRSILAKSQEVARVGNIAWDVLTGEVRASDQGFHILGYEPGETWFTIDHLLSHVYRDDSALVSRFLTAVVAEKKTGSIDYRIVAREGTVKYVNMIVDKIARDGAGEVTGAFGIVQDITDRKQAEEKTLASLREKEVLLKEIHHRVKNNLQIISSLLNLQSTYVRDGEALEMFRESQSRVKSMALIHEQLYQSRDLSSIDFRAYVRGLAGYLVQSYGTTAQAVQLSINTDDLQIDIDRAIPCGLILNELLTNAFKYAFPGGRSGRISVEFRRSGIAQAELYRLAVADDGVGLPPSLDLENVPTLGLQLVVSLVAQLEGTLVVNRERGTEFIITFPEAKKPNSLLRRDGGRPL